MLSLQNEVFNFFKRSTVVYMRPSEKVFKYAAYTAMCTLPAQMLFFVLDPQDVLDGTAVLPACLTMLFFEAECPGCGMGRALSLISHGRFNESIEYNKFAGVIFMLITLVNVMALVYFGRKIYLRQGFNKA